MLGAIVLLIAIVLYFTPYKRWSVFLFILFSMNTMRLLPTELLGIKFRDMAFIYMLVIGIYSYLSERKKYREHPLIRQLVLALCVFFICSVLFSAFYYGYDGSVIIQGGRHLVLFASYFFIRKLKHREILWIIKALFWYTMVHVVLYILQTLTGLPLLFIDPHEHIDPFSGRYRLYNFPILMPFFLFLLALYPRYFGKRLSIVSTVLIVVALILTQGRTYIIINLLALYLGLILVGKLQGIMKYGVLFLLLLLPFTDLLTSRFTGGTGTRNDIENVLEGNFANYSEAGYDNGGTLSYRFAWFYERFSYLLDRPLREQLFGLGMISDSQTKLILRRYNFSIGNDPETGEVRLTTPDIAWGNFVTQYGILGTLLMSILWGYLCYYLYQRRHLHPYVMAGTLFIIVVIGISIADSHISEPGNLVFPMLLLTFCLQLLPEKERPLIKHKQAFKVYKRRKH